MLRDWNPNGRNVPKRNQIYIVTVCCQVYYKCNCLKTFAICQQYHMQDIADTETTDYTSYARCLVVRRLAMNGYPYCGVVDTIKLKGFSAN
jgi:hypothetical protein